MSIIVNSTISIPTEKKTIFFFTHIQIKYNNREEPHRYREKTIGYQKGGDGEGTNQVGADSEVQLSVIK